MSGSQPSLFSTTHTHHSRRESQAKSPTSISTSRIRGITTRSSQQPGSNHQHRRLQLRNAGFRGIAMPARKITPNSALWSPNSEPAAQGNENEDTRTLSGGIIQRSEEPEVSSLGILQEISNSTRRRSRTARPDLASLFQDPELPEGKDEGRREWSYTERGDENRVLSLRTLDLFDDAMKLREGSPNSKTLSPIAKSPIGKQHKGKHTRVASLNSESFKYIEHLESQLAALEAQIQSLTSPTSAKAQAAKLRELATESRTLRQEVSEWESKYGDRVQGEIEQHAAVESDLRARVKSLEKDVKTKDAKVKGLEWELENEGRKSKDVAAFQLENRNLERRLDVLTKLLAQSPPKSNQRSDLVGSRSNDGQSRMPRPTSMMPRIPSTPEPNFSDTPIMPWPPVWDKASPQLSSDASESSRDPDEDNFDDLLHYPSKRFRLSYDLDTAFSGPDASSMMGSSHLSFSRPTSVASDVPLSPIPWGLPLPSPSENKSRASNKPRRTRRFASGSCSLKPLILPTATSAQPISASPMHSPAIRSRDVSGNSVDPTTAFLSENLSNSPVSTTAHFEQAYRPEMRDETFRSLERESPFAQLPEPIPETRGTPPPVSEFLNYPDLDETVGKAKGRTLLAELDLANVDADEDETVTLANSTRISSPRCFCFCHQSRKGDALTARSISVSHRQSPKKTLSTSQSPVSSLFASLLSVISDVRQSPTQLARKIITNAWYLTAGTKTINVFAWWLLGLFLGPIGRRERKQGLRSSFISEAERTPSLHLQTVDRDQGRTISQQERDHSSPVSDADRRCNGIGVDAAPFAAEGITLSSSVLSTYVPSTTSNNTQYKYHRCKDCTIHPSSSLWLWLKLSVAIVLAVGVAVKNGPGTLFAACPRPHVDEQSGGRNTALKLLCPTDGGEKSRKRNAVDDHKGVENKEVS
ncbi:MAG: hypothetical protein M1827_003792 [Pycnora praestabilis]|nr:MAG: hypothetical protein M1827_003792 [Pycnora praestabilis]